MLADTLDLTRDCYAAYLEADGNTRRLFNQAFFTKIYIDEDDETRERSVRVDYNQPFDDLLSRLVPAHVHRQLEVEKQTSRPEPRTGGDAFTTGVAQGQGCPPSTLVELRGIEPRSSSVERSLLRVQFVRSLFSAPGLARTPPRRAQSGLSPGQPP